MSTLEDFMQVEFKVSNIVYVGKIWVGEDDSDLYYQVAFYPQVNPDEEKVIFVKQGEDLNWIQKPDTHINDLVEQAIVDAIGLEIDDYE